MLSPSFRCRILSLFSVALLLAVITFASVALAQTSNKDKVELGVHSTSLTLFGPDFPGDQTFMGFGGRVTYNFNQSIAAEAEINFFPQKLQILAADGNAIQAQFGVKAGKRFEKFGLFAKVRPGFLNVDNVFSLQPDPATTFAVKFARTTFFTLDAGGVLELYPSRRTVVRFEAGDTAVRHPEQFELIFAEPSFVRSRRPAKFNHNFQFTAGVGFRLGDFPASESNLTTAPDTQEHLPRYELGAQFTSLTVDPPSTACRNCVSVSNALVHTEPGFGGRFTFNLTRNIGVEAEGNYYTRELLGFVDPAGHIFQGQFGAKVGKRFDKWGLFAKARPGFVGYTRVPELVGTHTVLFGTIPVVLGDFRTVKKLYPSVDLGGVVEFYIARRWMARFDIGDTVIRYGELQATGFSLSMPIVTRPAETRHNLQVTSGLGFRF